MGAGFDGVELLGEDALEVRDIVNGVARFAEAGVDLPG
jgi:hypothetical protein